MNQVRIYLSGPMAGCDYVQMHQWREDLKAMFKGGVHWLDPTTRMYSETDRSFSAANDVVVSDKMMIDTADLIVCFPWKPSTGTAMEVQYAVDKGKPVLVVAAEPFEDLNPWYRTQAYAIMPNKLDMVAAAIRQFIANRDIPAKRNVFMTAEGPVVTPADVWLVATDQGTVSAEGEVIELAKMFAKLCRVIHNRNAKWWTDMKTGERLDRNYGELLMLVVSELAESMEGDRKDLKDDHLLECDGRATELVDAVIRICDMFGGLEMDPRIFAYKLAYNAVRADHKHENRLKDGGKKY